MNKNASLSLGDHFSGFIKEQVSKGRYGSASDVVCAGLRLLEEQEARLSALRAALVEGEESGASTEFDFDRFIAGKRKAELGAISRDGAGGRGDAAGYAGVSCASAPSLRAERSNPGAAPRLLDCFAYGSQ